LRWDKRAGAEAPEGAPSDEDLIVRLREVFQPVAPTVQICRPMNGLLRTPLPSDGVVRYRHYGVGLPSSLAPNSNIYSSKSQRTPAAGQQMPKPFEAKNGS
jgi:hypothetical protein